MFSKFKKEWTSQSSDKKKKNTEAVRDEMKRILAEFNVSAKKYYASQFLSLGNSLAKDTEGILANCIVIQYLKDTDYNMPSSSLHMLLINSTNESNSSEDLRTMMKRSFLTILSELLRFLLLAL